MGGEPDPAPVDGPGFDLSRPHPARIYDHWLGGKVAFGPDRAAAEKVETPPWEQITEGVEPTHAALRSAVGQLMGAVAQSAYSATDEQQQRIVDIVNNARRDVYQILGEG